MIKFVSYSGKYPCLCMGVLTVEIDGKEYKFGHESESYNSKTCMYEDGNFDAFWKSGGSIRGNWQNMYCDTDEWELSIDSKYPEWVNPLFNKLIRIFNENVPQGCCGGCI